MFQRLRTFFQKEQIDCFGFLPFSFCKATRTYLYEKYPTLPQSVIIVAIPYATDRVIPYLSRYAVSKDYHLYFESLWNRCVSELQSNYSNYWFAGFADHSPIDEISAAVSAGLGVKGDHHLLITKKYGSYVFLGELLTDYPFQGSFVPQSGTCSHCGACKKACPSFDHCLSAITQKKQPLSEKEISLLQTTSTAWGCDRCQEVCPENREASLSPIPFFWEDRIDVFDIKTISQMSTEDFQKRAFAWRGRECVLRNLSYIEETGKKDLN